MRLQRSLDMLMSTGLSTAPEEIVYYTDEPKIPGFLSFPNKQCEEKYHTKEVIGQGYDPSKIKAKVKATAEFLERLAIFNPVHEKLTMSVYDPNGNFIDPFAFFCYSSDQVPGREEIAERIRKENYRWISGKDVLSGRDVLIPAQTVFLSPDFGDEFPIRKETVSTGAALGLKNSGYAFNAGLLEVIERDACIHSYLTKRAMKRIVNPDEKVREIMQYFNRYNFDLYIFDATSDLNVPTILAVTIDRTGIGPAINVGSASGLDYKHAMEHAILESIHCRRHARLMKDEDIPEGFPGREDVLFPMSGESEDVSIIQFSYGQLINANLPGQGVDFSTRIKIYRDDKPITANELWQDYSAKKEVEKEPNTS